MQQIIINPIITEKAMKDAEKGKFTFRVDLHADKAAIKQEIEKRFNVQVEDISTVILKGKTKRVGKQRREISGSPIKKAMVKLKGGQKIDIFELGS